MDQSQSNENTLDERRMLHWSPMIIPGVSITTKCPILQSELVKHNHYISRSYAEYDQFELFSACHSMEAHPWKTEEQVISFNIARLDQITCHWCKGQIMILLANGFTSYEDFMDLAIQAAATISK
jgi:hypothetical protein